MIIMSIKNKPKNVIFEIQKKDLALSVDAWTVPNSGRKKAPPQDHKVHL